MWYYRQNGLTTAPILRGWLADFQNVDQITFTGQHISRYDFLDIKVGYIVCSNGKYKALNTQSEQQIDNILIDESVPIVEYSIQAYDKKVFGVISKKEEDKRIVGEVFQTELEKHDERVIIYSIGEGAIWVSIENGHLENGDYICSSSLDGIGMKQEVLQEVWSLSKKNAQSTRLGCEISKLQADLLGANLFIESQHLKGTTVTFFLKCQIAHESESPAFKKIEGNLQIAIVDDQSELAFIMKSKLSRVLRNANFSVFRNAEELIMSEKEFDIITLDEFMQGSGGILRGREAIQVLREKGCKAILVGISAHLTAKEWNIAGANLSFSKPIPNEEEIFLSLSENLKKNTPNLVGFLKHLKA